MWLTYIVIASDYGLSRITIPRALSVCPVSASSVRKSGSLLNELSFFPPVYAHIFCLLCTLACYFLVFLNHEWSDHLFGRAPFNSKCYPSESIVDHQYHLNNGRRFIASCLSAIFIRRNGLLMGKRKSARHERASERAHLARASLICVNGGV